MDLLERHLDLIADETPFTVVLEGVASDLPGDILTSGNYLVVNRSDLVGKELLIVARTSNGDFEVTTHGAAVFSID